MFRARPTVDDVAKDLAVVIEDMCFAGCNETSPVEIAFQIENRGGSDITNDVVVALYALDGATETFLLTHTVAGGVVAGTSSGTEILTIRVEQIGSTGIMLRVDDDGTGTGSQNECDDSNNHTAYFDWPC